MNYKTERFDIDLITFDSFNGFVKSIDWEKHLELAVNFMGNDFDVTHKVRRMELGDFSIRKHENVFVRSGVNTWYLCDFYNQFGVRNFVYINGDIFKNLPFTVWIRRGDNDQFGKWCGEVFLTEEQATTWMINELEKNGKATNPIDPIIKVD